MRWRHGGELMDQARVEFLLDDGWNLIGRLHQWLSRLPAAPADQASYLELIGRLQTFWAAADDLELTRIARASLCLEQVLERFCATGLQISEVRLQILTAGVGTFQELLLAFEATREEPVDCDMVELLQLERQMLLTVPVEQPATPALVVETPSSAEVNPVVPVAADQPVVPAPIERSLNRKLVTMLDRFATKLDDACQRLHRRMVADESPYVTTTSRLEHLSKATRQLARKLRVRTKLIPWASAGRQTIEAPMLNQRNDSLALASTATNAHSIARLDDTRLNSETTLQIDELPSVGMAEAARQVLILEESLFYRHLITIALRSSGYQTVTVDLKSEGLFELDQVNKVDAIVLGSKLTAEILDAVQRYREYQGGKVIVLSSSDSEPLPFDVDDQVTKSHPQQLINALDRCFATESDELRKTA